MDNSQDLLTSPVAKKQPHVLELHGDSRIDNYFWMRDIENPEVTGYLEVENSYTQAVMQPTEALQEQLYEEILSRIQETDLSVPSRKDNYYYYSRTEEGKAYGIHCRKKDNLDAPEEVLLDENKLAQGHDFFSLGVFQISPNHEILAYSTDTNGAEIYTLYFLDLKTFKHYAETIPNTYYSFTWANDNKTVFYTVVDEANRPFKLFRHQLGTEEEQDILIFHEPDESYFIDIGKTRSDTYIIMSSASQVTSEAYYLDANNPTGSFELIEARHQGVEYDVDHHDNYFYIVTNDGAINFKLMKTSVNSPSKENWQVVIPHREDVMLSGISIFAKYLVIYERKNGLPCATIRDFETGKEHDITFPEPTYGFFEGSNPEFNTNILRFSYTSLISPMSVFDYDMETNIRELKKETEVLGGYDKSQFGSEMLMAPGKDGVKIPISIVYKKGVKRDGNNPLFLTGYGSYGFPYPATFSSSRLPLLERGIVYAIAHIRGGGEMGRKWYESGKFLYKKNTFDDFIASAEYLINEKWTSSQNLAISGGSAGGLLMGAVINIRPELFKVVVADVPFVDVISTIVDTSLPLSAIEWDEWGNPNDKVYYNYMKSYSPYDNVKAQNYPHLLITAGLNDPRVKYWEPAKWTAKLREMKTDDNILLLKTNMGAGHGGASGRYESLKELAFEYAFVFKWLGVGSKK